jgi:hypothetical protein
MASDRFLWLRADDLINFGGGFGIDLTNAAQ